MISPLIYALWMILIVTEAISSCWYMIFLCVSSAGCCIMWVCLNIAKDSKFSGVPFLSDEYKKKTDYVRSIVFYWIVCRAIESGFYMMLSIIMLITEQTLVNLATFDDEFWGVFFYFGYAVQFLITEFLAGIFCLDKTFVEFFDDPIYFQALDKIDINIPKYSNKENFLMSMDSDDNTEGHEKRIESFFDKKLIGNSNYSMQSHSPIQKRRSQETDLNDQNLSILLIDKKNRKSSNTNSADKNDVLRALNDIVVNGEMISYVEVQFNTLKIFEDIVLSRKFGLGKVKFGSRFERSISLREIPISNISHFMIEELVKEILFWKQVPIEGILKYRNYCYKDDTLY